jgi:hypothetical protein
MNPLFALYNFLCTKILFKLFNTILNRVLYIYIYIYIYVCVCVCVIYIYILSSS